MQMSLIAGSLEPFSSRRPLPRLLAVDTYLECVFMDTAHAQASGGAPSIRVHKLLVRDRRTVLIRCAMDTGQRPSAHLHLHKKNDVNEYLLERITQRR
jgi:hypothetical protein